MGVVPSLDLTSAAAHTIGLTDIVRDEGGFEGAVRVVERWADDEWGYLTVTIPYRDMRGQTRLGQGRLYLTRDMGRSRTRRPVYCAACYEITQKEARELCDLGYIVATPHYGEYQRELSFGGGYNLMKALIQWVRRLKCVDRLRLQIGGGSAGGYMTLAMAAEFFPISALVSDLPAVNWAYTCNYMLVNQESSGYLLPPDTERPLPVLTLIIGPIGHTATDLFGSDLSAPTWHTLSPISYVDRITAPALVRCATGDMLCTIESFTARRFFTLPLVQFPENYQRDFNALTLCPQARRRLDECIGSDELSVYVISSPKGTYEYTIEDMNNLDNPLHRVPESPEIALPWSKEKQWSLVILDEGAPLPHLGHTRYQWNASLRGFMNYHRDRAPQTGQLNLAKLKRLMERFAGHLTEVAKLADGTPANRLNYAALERLDVLTGLVDYAGLGPEHAKRLEDLYSACPVQPFGTHLRFEALRDLEARLCRDLAPDVLA